MTASDPSPCYLNERILNSEQTCDPSCVYSQEDAVFEELCEVHLSRFLHRPQSVGLEAETLDPPLGRLLGGNLSDHPSEWQAWDQEVGRLLVLPDLHQSSDHQEGLVTNSTTYPGLP